MDFYAVAGILGTVFSISTFLIPERWKSKKITLALFVFSVVVLSTIIVNQNSKLSRINRITRVAEMLVKSREFKFTNAGYIQAGLAFLEQNKDLYPDSYRRAVMIYDKYKSNENAIGYNVVDLAYEMDGLINGIAILNEEKDK